MNEAALIVPTCKVGKVGAGNVLTVTNRRAKKNKSSVIARFSIFFNNRRSFLLYFFSKSCETSISNKGYVTYNFFSLAMITEIVFFLFYLIFYTNVQLLLHRVSKWRPTSE